MNNMSSPVPGPLPNRGIDTSVEPNDVTQTVREFRIMLRYVLAQGLEIDEKTSDLVARVEENLTGVVAPPAASAAAAVSPTFDHPPTDFGRLVAAHSALAKIISPATPRSLEATEPIPGWLGSLRRPPLVLAMIIVAVIAAVGFIVTSIVAAEPAKTPGSDTKTARVTVLPALLRVPTAINLVTAADSNSASLGVPVEAPAWQRQLNWCFAAALGAVFYILFTAHDYVKTRTFDPRYNSLYMIRFVLGILAGLILANVVSAPLLNKNETVRNLGPAIVALLGGFSTEAVEQVLQRFVDILLAAVRGDNSGAAKTKASEDARKELLNIADDPAMPPNLKSKAIAAAKKVGA